MLEPLKNNEPAYRAEVFDYRTEAKIDSKTRDAEPGSILIMEGVFLFRPEIVRFWDVKLFLDIGFEESIARAVHRESDKAHLGANKEIISKYKTRYIPGQQLYFEQVNPRETADIVIDNRDFENPQIVKKV